MALCDQLSRPQSGLIRPLHLISRREGAVARAAWRAHGSFCGAAWRCEIRLKVLAWFEIAQIVMSIQPSSAISEHFYSDVKS